MNEYWWVNFIGGIGTWWYNRMTRVGGAVVRMFGLQPRCSCGWRLSQRFDGMWLCGHCVNVAFPERDVLRGRRELKDWPCNCMLCDGTVRNARSQEMEDHMTEYGLVENTTLRAMQQLAKTGRVPYARPYSFIMGYVAAQGWVRDVEIQGEYYTATVTQEGLEWIAAKTSQEVEET